MLHPSDNSAFVALKSAQDRKDNLAENWEESQETKAIGASMIMDRGLRKLTRALFSESLSGGGSEFEFPRENETMENLERELYSDRKRMRDHVS